MEGEWFTKRFRVSFAVGVCGRFGRFHQRYINYLHRQFIPKWNYANAEYVLGTASITSLNGGWRNL